MRFRSTAASSRPCSSPSSAIRGEKCGLVAFTVYARGIGEAVRKLAWDHPGSLMKYSGQAYNVIDTGCRLVPVFS